MTKTVLFIDNATKLIVAETNPPGDLTTLEDMQGQGFTSHSIDHQWACRVLVAPASGMTIANNDGVAGDPTFAFTGELASLLSISTTGMMSRNVAGVWTGRTLTGTTNQVIVADGDGLTANPTLSLPQDIHTGATGVTFGGLRITGHTGMQKAVGGFITDAVANADFLPGTTGAAIQKADGAGGLTGAIASTDYIAATTGAAMQKANGAGGLTGASASVDFLAATTGASIQKADGAGGLTAATASTDFLAATTGSAMQKANGSGGLTAATASTDFLAATTGAAIQKANGAGGLTGASASVDFLAATTGSAIQKADGAGGLTGATPNTDYLPVADPTTTGTLTSPKIVNPDTLGAEQITVTKNKDFSATPDWAGVNWKRPVTGTLTDVTVSASGKTFTRGAGDFTTDGFQVGMTATWAGFVGAGNTTPAVITTLTALVMTCAGATLTNEAAGVSVSATSDVWAHTAGANSTNLPSANLTTSPVTGAVYQLVYDVVTGVTGTLQATVGGAVGLTLGTAIGTVTASTERLTACGTGDLTLVPNGAWVGWIDNVSLKIITPGTLVVGHQSFTSSALTIAATGLVGPTISKFTWTNAMIVGLGASLTGDLKVCSLPPRTVIKNAYLVVDGQATAAGTLSGSLGITGATYVDLLDNSDLKASPNAVYGSATGERKTNLTGYKFTSMTSTVDVYMHVISGTGNLDAVTTSAGTIYLETVTLP